MLLLVCLAFGPGEARAAGFSLYEYSARGNALAGTTIAREATPASLAMNPAQVARVPGLQLEAGVTMITATADVTYAGESQNVIREYFFAPHSYLTWEINEKISAGLGIFSRFGLGSLYPEDWAGRFEIYRAAVKSASVQPTVAVNVTGWLSLGLGLEIIWLDIDIRNKIALNHPIAGSMGEVDSKLKGDNFAYGGVIGLHLHPRDWLSIGASYRNSITHSIGGQAEFNKSGINPLFRGGFEQAFQNMGARGEITLPAQTALGIAIKPWKDWTFEVDAIYTEWNSFKELKIDFNDNIMKDVAGLAPITSTTKEKDWKNVWRLSAGAEYTATDWLTLRLGYSFDQSPMRTYAMDALIPAHDRHLTNAGLGLNLDDWKADFAYTYLKAVNMYGETPSGVPISYKNSDAHMLALTATYEF